MANRPLSKSQKPWEDQSEGSENLVRGGGGWLAAGFCQPGVKLMQTKTIALPKLNNLSPSLESTAIKLMEEAGELGAAIGKFRGLNGEKVDLTNQEVARTIGRELLDVAQTAITMMFVLEEQFHVDINSLLEQHVDKLIRKGYLSPVFLENDPDDARGRNY